MAVIHFYMRDPFPVPTRRQHRAMRPQARDQAAAGYLRVPLSHLVKSYPQALGRSSSLALYSRGPASEAFLPVHRCAQAKAIPLEDRC